MTVEMWAAIVGFALPALVAVVNREEWMSWVKALVALGSSVLAGTVTALLSGDFTGATWTTAIGVAFAASMASYKLWWKSSGISDMIEEKVNIISGKPAAPTEDGTPGDSSTEG